jgi:hypothetical protein
MMIRVDWSLRSWSMVVAGGGESDESWWELDEGVRGGVMYDESRFSDELRPGRAAAEDGGDMDAVRRGLAGC